MCVIGPVHNAFQIPNTVFAISMITIFIAIFKN